ncbi:hypothetical protein Tbd_1212 [Thiobacillus denitrificans ATCC 25259]|uniref:Uncharacterized protein n=1 Tax=Thiobacillus denitrificans (strain ATCC 25259 / T1) TaxID=292415 RepID=Q3SJJ2_THIDA|nr:hypothetical protein Tbd_1212 [Thiobacillus denitrificans ATCC 25259]
MLPARQFRSLLPSLSPHLGVVAVMAPLAQRSEVQQARRFWPVVEYMRRRQNYFPARYRVRLPILGSAPLAAVLCAVEAHKPAAQFPVCRVAFAVLWSYRHCSSNPTVKFAPLRSAGTRRSAPVISTVGRRAVSAAAPANPLGLRVVLVSLHTLHLIAALDVARHMLRRVLLAAGVIPAHRAHLSALPAGYVQPSKVAPALVFGCLHHFSLQIIPKNIPRPTIRSSRGPPAPSILAGFRKARLTANVGHLLCQPLLFFRAVNRHRVAATLRPPIAHRPRAIGALRAPAFAAPHLPACQLRYLLRYRVV